MLMLVIGTRCGRTSAAQTNKGSVFCLPQAAIQRLHLESHVSVTQSVRSGATRQQHAELTASFRHSASNPLCSRQNFTRPD